MQLLKDEESKEYSIPIFIGFNQGKRHNLLEAGETINAQNMIVDDGDLEVMSGFTKYLNASLPAGIKTLMVFYRTNVDGSVTKFLLAATANSIYKYNTSTLAWDIVKSGATSGYYDYINYQEGITDLILCGNGVDPSLKWDGNTGAFVNMAGSPTPPKFSSVALHYERVWCCGEKENPNRVYYSKDLEPENWDTTVEEGAGFYELPTWDGGICIGIGVVSDEVIIFKTRNIFRITGTYPGEFQKYNVFSTTGAIAERSIANNKSSAFFLAKDGIYGYNGVSTQKISYAVDDIIKTMNKNYADKAVGTIFNDKYILAIPTGSSTENDTIIEYDLKNQNFIVKRGINITTFVEFDDKLLFANNSLIDGKCYIYQYNTGSTLDGALINAFWETPDTDWQAPNARKTSTYIDFTALGTGDIKLEAIFNDKGIEKSVSKVVILTGSNKVYKVRLKNRGRRFRFKFSNVNGSYFKVSNVKVLMDVDLD